MQKFKHLFDVATSIGAAVVIFGAWQKITHRSYADAFLTIGLLTECLIFIGYALIGLSQRKVEQVVEPNQTGSLASPMMPSKLGELERVSMQLSQLHENLDQLNTVYSGMLKAMRGKE